MNVAVIGSRDFRNVSWGRQLVDHLPKSVGLVITTHQGIPRAIEEHSRTMSRQPCIKVPLLGDANREDREAWKAQLKERNDNLLRKADILVAFWDGKDFGVGYVMESAALRGMPTFVLSDNMSEAMAGYMIGLIYKMTTDVAVQVG